MKEIIDMDYPYYAHIKEGEKERLIDHIHCCQQYFLEIYKEKDMEKILHRFLEKMDLAKTVELENFGKQLFFNTILFHDFGKCNPRFQKQKMKNDVENHKAFKNSHHSIYSSLIFLDYFWNEIEENQELYSNKDEKKKLFLLVAEHAYIISKHHGSLDSMTRYIGSNGILESDGNIKNFLQCMLQNELDGYKGFRYLSEKKVSKHLFRLYKNKKGPIFTQEQSTTKYFYYRLLYSVLVHCDYYATTEFMQGVKIPACSEMKINDFKMAYEQSPIKKTIENYRIQKYQGLEKDWASIHEMNDLRSEMFLDAEMELQKDDRYPIYFLEAPTGSGKSNTAINLSFHLMKDKKKLFYIYPFNTLVEQNLQTLQELFPEERLQQQIAVINSLHPIKMESSKKEESELFYQKALLDRQFLQYPFILSTHVSFFETLFSNKRENLFGFFQLANSVIVLDEIQSYKNSIWSEIIIFLKSCAELMGMKVIIMSATLPDLEQLYIEKPEDAFVKRLLANSKDYFQHPIFKNRVQISYELLEKETDEISDILLQHILNQPIKEKKIVIEFIKKQSAYTFYYRLLEKLEGLEDKVSVLCMTGDDSLYERKKILQEIKESKKGLILVATQVIEAGVDIDMDIGYKDVSLLDNEEQFMGRINRSCKRKGIVYFFKKDDFNLIYKGDCRQSANLTLQNEKMREILLQKDFQAYYQKVLEYLKEQNKDSENGASKFFKEEIKKLEFEKIAQRMKLIDENNWKVSIVFCRNMQAVDGSIFYSANQAEQLWNDYKSLLLNRTMEYAKRQVELSKVRTQLQYFTYQIPETWASNVYYHDMIGELRCVFDADEYFINGKLNVSKLSGGEVNFM